MIWLKSKIRTVLWVCLIATGWYIGMLTLSSFPATHALQASQGSQTAMSHTSEHVYAETAGTNTQHSYVQSSLELLLEQENTTPFKSFWETNNNKEFYTLLHSYFDTVDDERHLELLQGVMERLIDLPEETVRQNNLNRDWLLTSLWLIFINAPASDVDSSQDLYGVERVTDEYIRLTINDPAEMRRASFHLNSNFYSSCTWDQCNRYILNAEQWDEVTIYYTTDRWIDQVVTFTL